MLAARPIANKTRAALSPLDHRPIYSGMRFRILVGLSLVAPSTSSPAAAQRPGSVEFSALGVWHTKTTVHDGLRGFGTGARLGVWLPAGFELEGQVDWTRPENSIVPARYSLLHLGAGALINFVLVGGRSAYLRAGYGRLDPRAPCTVHGVACRAFGAINAGAGFRFPLGGTILLRMEGGVRSRSSYDYTSVGASVGVTVLSGRGPGGGSGRMADEDRDGVPDGRDRCQATISGALVDLRGCPTDLDGDAVFDGIDRCPATPKGTPVDAIGCPAKRPE
jgi:hypothetical protein